MNPSSQHIALMESLGWKRVNGGISGYGYSNGEHSEQSLPPLTLDLMAQAEAMLTGLIAADYYGKHLPRTTGSGIMSLRWQQNERLAGATKEQRLEAFLRAKGLWRDGPKGNPHTILPVETPILGEQSSALMREMQARSERYAQSEGKK